MKYIATNEIKHNGKIFKIGQQIDLADDEAKQIPYAIKKAVIKDGAVKNNSKNNSQKKGKEGNK